MITNWSHITKHINSATNWSRSKFIDIKKSEYFRLTENSHSKQFFDELRQFVELSETEGSFSDFDLEQTDRLQKIDLFEENVKVKGVVVCKFSKKAKVCVLIKTKDPCRGLITGSFSLSEVFVDLREEDDTDHEGFHLKLHYETEICENPMKIT